MRIDLRDLESYSIKKKTILSPELFLASSCRFDYSLHVVVVVHHRKRKIFIFLLQIYSFGFIVQLFDLGVVGTIISQVNGSSLPFIFCFSISGSYNLKMHPGTSRGRGGGGSSLDAGARNYTPTYPGGGSGNRGQSDRWVNQHLHYSQQQQMRQPNYAMQGQRFNTKHTSQQFAHHQMHLNYQQHQYNQDQQFRIKVNFHPTQAGIITKVTSFLATIR